MGAPISRVSRLLNEGARFMVKLPGQEAIDLTPDVMAALNEVQSRLYEFGPRKESIDIQSVSRGVPTGVHFP